jgi:hypothetical protein
MLFDVGSWWPEALSVIAMVLSGAALAVALQISRQTERRADAERGDLPPNLALYPAGPGIGADKGPHTLELRIDNHNRRPLRITGLNVEQPSKMGLVAYQPNGTADVLLGDMDRAHNEVLTNLVIDGTPAGASGFNATRLKLVLSGDMPRPKRKTPGRLRLRVDFELLQGEPERRSEIVTLELQPAQARKERPAVAPALAPGEAVRA